MVEQAHTGKGHDNVVLVALGNHQVIPDRAAGLGNIADTGSIGPLDVIRKGEERVGTQGNTPDGAQEGPLVLLRQALGLAGKVVLPDAVGANVLFIAVDVAIDDIVPIGSAQVLTEGQVQGLGVLAQEPGIRLGACQPVLE